jgi:hypothetical protein
MKPPASSRKQLATTLAIIAVVAVVAVGVIAFSPKKKSGSTADTGTSTDTATSAAPTTTTATSYKDGSYSASGSYRTPQSTESVNVSLTIKGGVVTDATVTSSPTLDEAKEYQDMFKANYKPLVVGKNLNDISLRTVSGSSLTPGGFNTALQSIKSQAKA